MELFTILSKRELTGVEISWGITLMMNAHGEGMVLK
jgi:hypothetical protein